MRLGYVVLKLRLANTSFENRIGGSAALALALESTLAQEMVFVIPLSETVPANAYDSGINQLITERFGLVVALKMDADPADKTGIRAFDRLHDVRAEFLSVLSGWEMPDAGVDSLVYYVGGRLLDFNRAWMWYQFEFEFQTRLEEMTQPDTTDVGVLNKIYAQYVLGPWSASNAKTRNAVKDPAPFLTIDETDPIDGLRLVDMEQIIEK